MGNKSDFNYNDGDDLSWSRYFEMAEDYEESELFQEYDDASPFALAVFQNITYKTPEEALKVLFGYDSFRTGQKEIIDRILDGKDVFAVMPTGAGKSVCYQIPALMLPGITLVISPLISLMQDQVKALNEAGVNAAFINSSLSENAFHETLDKAGQGLYKIIYAAPERLMTDSFLELAGKVEISMVTVDEAHCISQWGQDFRPSYMKIVEFVGFLKKRPVMSAFTATATQTVREDVVCSLGLKEPFVLVTGFNRENLFFQVNKPADKDRYILDYISRHQGDSGIIYCATRKNVEKLYELLKGKGISVVKYHAGMNPPERKRMQDEFVFDYVDIVVATNAFGMGIDKSNVRFVIHYNMPSSMENYYQEAGRAGRDGLDSKCILLFSPQDIILNRFLLDHKDLTELDLSDLDNIRERDRLRLQAMERYCYTTDCLRNYILSYFGENPDKPCGDCGNCLREFETRNMTQEAKKIINCVYEARGRFGKTIIIDTVVGAKTARLEETGAIRYRSYGALASYDKNLLRRLIEQLILEGYLKPGPYQVLQMGDISGLKKPDAAVLVKISDEDARTAGKKNQAQSHKGKEALTAAGFDLFENLRKLRFSIAREESLPPYIVFSDKTLADMAVRMPVNEKEMLSVSGVGSSKCAKYGDRFIQLIEKALKEDPGLAAIKEKQAKQEPAWEEEAPKKRKGKKEYMLLREEAANFQFVELRYVSEIREEMNRICQRDDVKKLSFPQLSAFLIENGLIRENEEDEYARKKATAKGKEFGIVEIEKVGAKGTVYTNLMYPERVQRMILDAFTVKDSD